MPHIAPLRVGSVPYLVARPIDVGLGDEPDIELTHAIPALLVEQLRAGEVDVALVSSIELFRRPGYGYLESSAITGQGFVASVQVFLRRALEEVRTVALDPASRTAQALTRVTLLERARRENRPAPEFIEAQPGDDPEQLDADAWLRIGDPALRQYLSKDCPPLFNPSEAWCEERRLPFVFAAWIVRPGIELSDEQRAAFARARERGLANLDQLAAEASASWDLPLGPCRRYLGTECRYAPGQEMSAALEAFQGAAGALGLCRTDLSPRSIQIPAPKCPS